MDNNATVNCVMIASGIDLRTLILAASLIVSTIISIVFYNKNRSYGFENSLNERLFQIQKLAFDNPFVEEKKFINQWDELIKKYRDNKFEYTDIDKENIKQILQYEQYVEMIFNLISDNYSYKKSEKYLLRNIDLKNWSRTHKKWWNNPMEEHSNRESYGDDLSNIIDKWMK